MHKTVTKPAGWSLVRLCVGAASAFLAAVYAPTCWPDEPDSTDYGISYQTDIGEQRMIALSDGASIVLDTQSVVRVVMLADARKVYLDEGQAAIRVGSGSVLPLSVHVDRLMLQATKANFGVRRKPEQTIVSVIEGTVKVTPLAVGENVASRIRVRAGMRIAVATSGEISSRSSVAAVLMSAWQQQRLVFRRDTLIDIAAEFNRYNRTPKLRVEGELLQARRCGGVFNAKDPEVFVQYLATDPRIEFDRSEPGFITIRLRDADVGLAATLRARR